MKRTKIYFRTLSFCGSWVGICQCTSSGTMIFRWVVATCLIQVQGHAC